MKKRRSKSQMIEDTSIRVFSQELPLEWVIHSYGSDYGIDFVVEIFDSITNKKVVETLGENIFIQLKASENVKYSKRKIYERLNVSRFKGKNSNVYKEIEVTKFTLDISDILTVQSMGLAIPVLLILVDINTEKTFFLCLNDYIDKVLIPEDPKFYKKSSKTIYIPINNIIKNKKENLVPLRFYGKRSKMYGAFSLFSYQHKEISFLQETAAINNYEFSVEVIESIEVFTKTALRQDIWLSHEFWGLVKIYHEQLQQVQKELDNGINEENYAKFINNCYMVWIGLSKISHTYEEAVREWFMPTYLGNLTS